jgi:hypothetical protein
MLTTFIEELASRGYIVVGIDHPFMGRVAMPDGSVTEPSEAQFKSRDEIYEYYSQDALFVIRKLREAQSADGILHGHLDLANIGAIGHSSGFVSASGACIGDSAVKACVNLDAPGTPIDRLLQIRKPLLWIRLQRAETLPEEFLTRKTAPSYEVSIDAANHNAVTDHDLLFSDDDQQRRAAERRLELIEEYSVTFLDRYLKGKTFDASERPGAHLQVH